jgi:hypothetical protein
MLILRVCKSSVRRCRRELHVASPLFYVGFSEISSLLLNYLSFFSPVRWCLLYLCIGGRALLVSFFHALSNTNLITVSYIKRDNCVHLTEVLATIFLYYVYNIFEIRVFKWQSTLIAPWCKRSPMDPQTTFHERFLLHDVLVRVQL